MVLINSGTGSLSVLPSTFPVDEEIERAMDLADVDTLAGMLTNRAIPQSMKIGPIDKLTIGWHDAPHVSAMPLGSSVEFKAPPLDPGDAPAEITEASGGINDFAATGGSGAGDAVAFDQVEDQVRRPAGEADQALAALAAEAGDEVIGIELEAGDDLAAVPPRFLRRFERA